MDLLDDEVFAVIMALIIVGSVFAAAAQFHRSEPFDAIGLLNSDCKIGDYPDFVLTGENITLCLYLFNHMGEPEAYMVEYKFGTPDTLPTNKTPSAAPVLERYYFVLDDNESLTVRETLPIPDNPTLIGENATLIFELWRYDPAGHEWVYTGKWVHLHVRVEGVPLP
ncbi:MAG: DUF1616 domain-containing protein [Desulfurococcales archaeon]|nr:DUF1616 domain-containing protein [Desulfurococcales archaeon]